MPRPARLHLPESVANHAVRVLRLDVGDALVLFDGDGGEYPGIIATAERGAVTVTLGEYSQVNRESPLDIWLLQALAVGDKMDWVVQKAVELGATAVLPWQAERSVLKLDAAKAAKRQSHWQSIAIAACEQCGRNRIPVVHLPQSLTAALAASKGRRVLGLMPGASNSLALSRAPMCLVIGPEGGFTDGEIATIHSHSGEPLALGPRVLRTETAGLAALSALNAQLGDFVLPLS